MQSITSPEQITDNIYRIRVPLPENPLKELNSYFIEGEERNLLIDTGFNHPACAAALKNGLDALHADMDRTDLFLTHLHSDHCGLAPVIVSPKSCIYISGTDVKYINDDAFLKRHWISNHHQMDASGAPADRVAAMFDFNPALEYAPESRQVGYVTVEDGDRIDVGECHFRLLAAPGHTPGQLCLWDESQRILISADHVLFDITPNITCWPEVHDSLGVYLESLRRFETLNVRLTLPGHRETGDYHTRIEELLRHHEVRLEECREALRKKPDSTTYEVASQITWNIRRRSWEDFPSSQLFFAIGECQAHLQHLIVLGEVSVRHREDGTGLYRLC